MNIITSNMWKLNIGYAILNLLIVCSFFWFDFILITILYAIMFSFFLPNDKILGLNVLFCYIFNILNIINLSEQQFFLLDMLLIFLNLRIFLFPFFNLTKNKKRKVWEFCILILFIIVCLIISTFSVKYFTILRIIFNWLSLFVVIKYKSEFSFYYLAQILVHTVCLSLIFISLVYFNIYTFTGDLSVIIGYFLFAIIILLILRYKKEICISAFYVFFIPIFIFGYLICFNFFFICVIILISIFTIFYYFKHKFKYKSFFFIVSLFMINILIKFLFINQDKILFVNFSSFSQSLLLINLNEFIFISIIIIILLCKQNKEKDKSYPINYENLKKTSLSIIIPIYNGEQFIKSCIDKVLQIKLKKEIIVINDGSNDNSLKLLREYSDKIILINLDKNLGVSHARNLGLKYATGDYITFIDVDDDFELDMHLKILTKMLNENADVGMCKYNSIDLNGNIMEYKNIHDFTFKDLPQTEIIRLNLLFYLNAEVWSTIYKAKLAKSILFEEQLTIGEDRLFQLKVALKAKKTILVNEVLYHYIQRPLSITYNSLFLQNVLDNLKLVNFLSKNEKEFLNKNFKKEFYYFKLELKWIIWLQVNHWQNFLKKEKNEIKECLNQIINNELCDYVLSNEKFDIYSKVKVFFIKSFGLNFYLNNLNNFIINGTTNIAVQLIGLKNFILLK